MNPGERSGKPGASHFFCVSHMCEGIQILESNFSAPSGTLKGAEQEVEPRLTYQGSRQQLYSQQARLVLSVGFDNK